MLPRTLVMMLVLGLSSCTIEARGEHLHVVGNALTTNQAEAEALVEVGEALHASIAALHPSDIPLDDEVRVELHGGFNGESPYVDDEGTLHLWSFSEAEGGYRAMYAHELVHAIAYDSLVAPSLLDFVNTGFYLEGWAEYLALLTDPDKTGFPLFGFDEDVVVGHWLKFGGPTLGQYRARHEELSLPCQGQSYIMRASWFRYVDEELGHEVLLELADSRDGMPKATAEQILGARLEQVDADWEAWALARYDEIPNADTQAEAYMARMGWYTPCLD